MGGNSSPLIADLFLLYKEVQYLRTLKRNNQWDLLNKMCQMNRYIDDIIVFDIPNFNNVLKNIYPPDLVAEKSNRDNNNLEYLDVKLVILNNEVKTSVFSKIDSFNFDVTVLTFLEDCVPDSLGYSVFGGQVLRFGRISSNIDDFLERVIMVLNILVERGYSVSRLIRKFERTLNLNSGILHKFGLFGTYSLVRFIRDFIRQTNTSSILSSHQMSSFSGWCGVTGMKTSH